MWTCESEQGGLFHENYFRFGFAATMRPFVKLHVYTLTSCCRKPLTSDMLLWRDRATLCDGGVFLQRDRATPWYHSRGTARRCVTRCYCRGTARRRRINGEGPRRVKIATTPCRLYFATILSAAQNFLATIWPLVEILRSHGICESPQQRLSRENSLRLALRRRCAFCQITLTCCCMDHGHYAD